MPRRRLILLAVPLLVGALAGVGVLASRHHTRHQAAVPPAPAPAPVVAAPQPPSPPAPAQTRTEKVALRRGDSLLSALRRIGIHPRTGHDIAAALKKDGADLRRLRPTQTFEVSWGLDGEPRSVSWEASPWLGYVVVSSDTGWRVERSETRPDVRVEAVQGKVGRSLFQAVEETGETAQLVLAFVDVFESDFDFTADTRTGDRFRLLVEKRYAGDTFVDYGRILAAQYVTDGRVLTGVGFESGPSGRYGFYDREGRSLRKTFLKSPLEFSRITSGFTYARPHPVLGGLRPHLAIDYAAPVGTPVRAVADGTVSRAGFDGGYGISVLVKHAAGYQTMYNHLSRLAPGLRNGARVRQRQVIGQVGMTGLATGPHLDYRVAKQGQWVNPLGEKFLPGEPIGASRRGAFLQHARALVERLERSAPFEPR